MHLAVLWLSQPSMPGRLVLVFMLTKLCFLLPPCCPNKPTPTNRTASAKKRLAVPYRAADLPSQRSEFQQPDVALVYSHLAYYGDGLKPHEFKQAVLMLLSRGPSEQGYHYNRWLAQGGKQTPGRPVVLCG